jgi:endo-1,4-beta-xylanase
MQNKYIGTCVGNNSNFYSLYYNSPTHIFYKTVNDNFNCVVAENEFKPYAVHTSRYVYNFANIDKLIAFSQKNNTRLRGHTLIWHSQLPSWLGAGTNGLTNTNNYTRDTLLKIMKEHITTIVSHCRGKVQEWDVVNEPFEGSGALRKSIWQQVIGNDFIDSAFVYAHQADPDALLYLNEYGVEEVGGSKSEAMFNLISGLKNKGIPIHGAGLQCHFSASGFNPAKVEQNIKRYAPLGLNCIITELDLSLPTAAFGNADYYKQQAINYATLANIWLRNDNSPTFTLWGFTDLYSWIPSNSGNTRGEALIFDTKYQPKPAYNAILNTIADKALKTDVPIIRTKDEAFKIVQTAEYIQVISNDAIKSINLYNLAGQCVKKCSNSIQLSVSDCKHGIYIIQVETALSRHSNKIIIQ